MQPAPAADATRLEEAAGAFYLASTPAELADAVERARAAGEGSARHHQLAASLAYLRSSFAEQFEHLHAALLDPANDQPIRDLVAINAMTLTFAERARIEALLSTLEGQHPDPAVRSFAAHLLADYMRGRGHLDTSKRLRAASGPRLRFAVVGTWDNDQGKGFDVEHEPEREIDLSARYDGALVEIGWRTDPPTSAYGADYNLGQLMSPSSWSIAYAVSAFRSGGGDHQLRITSSVPFKVWVNGALIYRERRIEATLFDQFILPVALLPGTNRILIKTAQNDGPWVLTARLTDPSGAPITVEPEPAGAPHATAAGGRTLDTMELLEARVAHLAEGARKDYLRLEWAGILGLRIQALELADAFVARHPESILGRYALASESWDHGERARTSDLLEELGKLEELTFLPLQRARFLQQEGFAKKARDALFAMKAKAPDSPDVALRFARIFEAEGWLEDRCAALEEADELRPGWVIVLSDLGDCYEKLGLEDDAMAIYRRILDEVPHQSTILGRVHGIALGNQHLDEAERIAKLMADLSPDETWTWHRLADVRRRRGDHAGAIAALERASSIDPDSAAPYQEIGRIAYLSGDRERAIEQWKTALTLNPDDEKLANRLSFLAAPEKKEPWEREVPDEDAIMATVALRTQIQPPKGADVIDLMDHEVTRFNGDGSTVGFATRVLHAINDEGRDQITQVSMPRGGRIRVLHAFAIDPQGRRLQVSSIRNRVARFRGLKVGSTVVLQYRHDAPPVGYLSKHVARSWWFQGAANYVIGSQWIVWADRGTKFHEWIQGTVDRTEQEIDGYVRASWTATNIPPLLAEPGMPVGSEVAMNMILSTVPSWDVFLEWEKALLAEVFRETADVKDLAASLVEGATSPKDKVERIHRYLMEDIRYQQDYEDHIAGVKPHASSDVVKRGYGDCKDKAVLFITLAKLAGVDVHFAILRTRPKGPVRLEVPMQQFDHAIVYVPKQAGIDEGRFYDPTADALDIETLRSDDPGSKALVLDTTTLEHTWRDIPYQAPELNRHSVKTTFELDYDGSASGTFGIEAAGSPGASVRKLARNPDKFQQGLQLYAARSFPGANAKDATAEEVLDLSKPARVSVKVEAPSLGRREGKDLRIRLPEVWSPEGYFRLAERKYPLILGAPFLLEWTTEIALPKGAKVVRLPAAGQIDAPCFRLERTSSTQADRVVITQRFVTKCERVGVEEYLLHRDKAEEMNRFYQEEIVIDVPKLDKSKSASL